jgi:hypothetical protein
VCVAANGLVGQVDAHKPTVGPSRQRRVAD